MNTELMKKEVLPVVQLANDLTIKDEQDYQSAGDMLKQVKEAQKKVKEKVCPITKKAHEAWKAQKAFENELTGPLKEAEGAIKNKMINYQEELEKQQAEQAEPECVEDAILMQAEAPKAQKVAGISTRVKWHAEVTDFAKLPDDYKLPDMQKLNKLAQASEGALNIPGVAFKSSKVISARA